MPPDLLDDEMRNAAFARVRFLSETVGNLSSVELKPGFSFRGARVPFHNPQRGIFKPRQMRYLLSIRTVFPKPGARVWYDDQRSALDTVFAADSELKYAFMGKNPDAADNRWLERRSRRGCRSSTSWALLLAGISHSGLSSSPTGVPRISAQRSLSNRTGNETPRLKWSMSFGSVATR